MVGKRCAKRSSPVASSQRWSTPWSAMRAAMARLTTSRGASSSTKRSPSRVAQQRAVAAQRLGEQRARHGRVVQRRRVELDELDVGHRHAGPQRHGDAVAGRLGRVGGDREELAGAAGGQHHVVGPHLDRPCARRRASGHARPTQRPPSTSRSRANQPSSTAPAGAVGGVDQGPLDLGPGGRAAGVHDRGRRVAALAGERQRPRGLAVELGARARSARGPGPGLRRPGCAPPLRRTARRPRPGCRPGAGRSSPRRRPAPRPRRPGPSGSPTGTARPWSGRPGQPAPAGGVRPAGRRRTARRRRCPGPGRRRVPARAAGASRRFGQGAARRRAGPTPRRSTRLRPSTWTTRGHVRVELGRARSRRR